MKVKEKFVFKISGRSRKRKRKPMARKCRKIKWREGEVGEEEEENQT